LKNSNRQQWHKFNAKPEIVDNKWFGSKKEAKYYRELKLRVLAGDVIFFLMQVPFDLPGKVKYRIDFQEFHSDGTVHFVDVKGQKTPMYKLKKKQVEDLYPIIIEEA
jgi:hypothetical protein